VIDGKQSLYTTKTCQIKRTTPQTGKKTGTHMPLFQRKILTRSLNEIVIPDDHKTILEEWAQSITSRSIYSQSEVSLHGHFIHKILIDILG
jgi:hypothetical protein